MVQSKVADAIKDMTPDEAVAYLSTQKWKAAPGQPAPVAPSDPGYGAWYNEVRDQGVGFTPGTWEEVRYLWITGVISDPVYMAAYRAWLGAAGGDAAADSGGDDAGGGGDGADDGPAEGKRLSFSR